MHIFYGEPLLRNLIKFSLSIKKVVSLCLLRHHTMKAQGVEV